jgi:pyruvate-formate lyase-activating enzyme
MVNRKDHHNSQQIVHEKARPKAADVRRWRESPHSLATTPDLLEWARRLAPAFYLDVGNVCNQHCLYCAVPRDKAYRAECEDVEWVSAAAVGHGYDCAALIGGEPTVWPNLLPTLLKIREGGVGRVVLATNGLTLAEPDYLPELVAAGVDTVGLSLDDFDPAVQGRLTRHEANPELVEKALHNLAASSDVHTYIYTVVTGALAGRMADHVANCLQWASRFSNPPAFIFAGLKPVATALQNWPELAISMADTAKLVAEAVDGLSGRATVAYRDIPLCLPHLDPSYSLDLFHEQAAIDLTTGATRPAPLARDRTFVAACEGCQLRKWCPGIYQDYVALHGDKEFHPVG